MPLSARFVHFSFAVLNDTKLTEGGLIMFVKKHRAPTTNTTPQPPTSIQHHNTSVNFA